MKTFKSQLLKQQQAGFTLVELMVVVAIIGVLSAVAIPNFRTYQAKAKTSEAKLQLAAIYSALTSLHSDYDSYGTCLAYAGYNGPGAQNYYAIGVAGASTPANDTVVANGGAGCLDDDTTVTLNADGDIGGYFWSQKKRVGVVVSPAAGPQPVTLGTLPGATAAATTVNNFVVGAVGVISTSATVVTCTPNSTGSSCFNINQNKALNEISKGY